MINAGICGASGYTGLELVERLSSHPRARIRFATSESCSGKPLSELFPGAPRLTLMSAQDAPLEEVDVVFLCLPHGAAAPAAVAALEAGARVIDLSADFRLRNPAVYARWYGLEHPAPHLLTGAVYGLTEFARAGLPGAQLVANPGCYPTSILLPLQPLLARGLVSGTIIADSKSGVSGAGRTPRQHTHFVEVSGNFSPYAIGRTHRHLPEMEQALGWWGQAPARLVFSPHLLPVPRGILSTIYLSADGFPGEEELRALYQEAFAGEPFVHLLDHGRLPSLAHVVRTNRCVFSLTLADDTLIITSAIDNLVKGAAGQALQNMNVMFGLDETEGLV